MLDLIAVAWERDAECQRATVLGMYFALTQRARVQQTTRRRPSFVNCTSAATCKERRVLVDAARADEWLPGRCCSISAVTSSISCLAADERRNLRRQVVGEVFERTQRREVSDQVGCEQLVDVFGLREILEPVFTEIAQAARRAVSSVWISSAQAPEEQHLAAAGPTAPGGARCD